jgi:hypothetical protein
LILCCKNILFGKTANRLLIIFENAGIFIFHL